MSIDDNLPAHSKYGPSSAYRWLRCPASILLTGQAYEIKPELRDATTPQAEEGTRAHTLVERALRKGCRVRDTVRIPEPGIELLEGYVDYVRSLDGELHIEHRVDILPPLCYGTADAVVIGSDTVHIVDLKFGLNPVPAGGNVQLLSYAWGVYKTLVGLNRHPKFCLAIYQPRRRTGGPPLDRWETNHDVVVGHGVYLERVIETTESGKVPSPKPGEHCMYCPALKITCGG